jgi:tetratricopeptide (TPR) repeat protein
MFFSRLRRQAKWVFAFIALIFALGFLVAGVGTGLGSGLGDYISDLLNREASTGTSLGDAREQARENPQDAQAQLELSRAAQSEGLTQEAISALERYRNLKPRDTDALQTLASLYGALVNEALRDAQVADAEAAEANIQAQLVPENSEFARALADDKITGTLSAQATERATAAQEEARSYARLQVAVYQDLTLLLDDDPLVYLQFGQAAETAGDYDSAIAAYERFVELAPDDPTTKQVKERIKLLEPFAESSG